MSDKESHLLRRDLACGNAQVPFVLPALIIHHYDKFSLAERFERFLDRVKRKVGGVCHSCDFSCVSGSLDLGCGLRRSEQSFKLVNM